MRNAQQRQPRGKKSLFWFMVQCDTVHSSEGGAHHGLRSVRQLVTLCPWSGDRGMSAGGPLACFLLILSRTPDHGTLLSSLNSPRTEPRRHLPGDSVSSQTGITHHSAQSLRQWYMMKGTPDETHKVRRTSLPSVLPVSSLRL